MAKQPAKKTSGKRRGSAAKPASKSSKSSSGRSVSRSIPDEQARELKEANLLARLDQKKSTTAKRPKKKSSPNQTKTLLDSIIEGMQERKAKHITVLNLKGIENRVSDYFVICDADSNIHVGSIADSVEETVEKLSGESAYHIEGRQNGEWILIDYINIVVHIFQREFREHYNLEGLWGDAEITSIN